MFYGIGHSLGASMGGLLCDKLGWRYAFGIQLPFILVYLLIAIFTTPNNLGPNLRKAEGKTIGEALKSFDVAGSVALAVAVAGLIFGLNLGGNVFPWTHPVPIVSLSLFAVSSVVLVMVERRATRPVLPLRFLSTFPMANLMISNFAGSIVRPCLLSAVMIILKIVRLPKLCSLMSHYTFRPSDNAHLRLQAST